MSIKPDQHSTASGLHRQPDAPSPGNSVSQQKTQPTQLNSRDNLFSSYLRIFREFRRRDLVEFCDRHETMYREALRNQDHLAVTQHYYGLMADVIETYYGDGWHFCPPEFAGQSRADATIRMYEKVAELLQAGSGQSTLDLGCGVGGMLRYVARSSGAAVTGITLGANEVELANQLIQQDGLDPQCVVVQGDCQDMPFQSSTFAGVYAVYSLKYYPDLNRVLSEIYRVLKPGGRFVAYCLCKSRHYRDDNPDHCKLLSDFEHSTAMPSLHSVPEIIEIAKNNQLRCVVDTDLSDGDLHWYSYWVKNPLLPWLVSSRLIYGLTRSAEAIRILPKGFARFNDTFLAGTLRHIIRGGKSGVLTGSALLAFEKE